MAEAYFEAHARPRLDAARRAFVDKTLGNYIHVGLIHLMLPKAMILHSVRDPVDTCLACYRKLFADRPRDHLRPRDIGREYVRYREMMDALGAGAARPGGRRHHEALVADPEAQIRWLVTEACGLDWDEACLRFYETRPAGAHRQRRPGAPADLHHLDRALAALREAPGAAVRGAGPLRAGEGRRLMRIDLRECQTLAISLPDATARRESVSALCQGLGLPGRLLDGVKASPGWLGCGLSHLRALREGDPDRPLLILEDDVAANEAFEWTLEAPDDADALYLGASIFGAVDMIDYVGFTYGVAADAVNDRLFRVYNLLSTHAILYLSHRFRRASAAGILEFMIDRGWAHDRAMAWLQERYNVYALRRPMFYQAAALQGPGGERQEEVTNIVMQPPAEGAKVTVEIEGQWVWAELRREQGILKWRWSEGG